MQTDMHPGISQSLPACSYLAALVGFTHPSTVHLSRAGMHHDTYSRYMHNQMTSRREHTRHAARVTSDISAEIRRTTQHTG
mmetsp:Transcript_33313/g.82538  ORF Transcript_33313/g.82538 Transcript_33313/m.82538 type:complete len:81 (-) Transcript_33313:347-589(-)